MELYRWLRYQWDRTTAVLLALAGFVALILGWFGVSRVTLPGEQIPYVVSGALLGLYALGAGATLWLSADLRDLWRKFDDMHRGLVEKEGAGSITLMSESSTVHDGDDRGANGGPDSLHLSAAARQGRSACAP